MGRGLSGLRQGMSIGARNGKLEEKDLDGVLLLIHRRAHPTTRERVTSQP